MPGASIAGPARHTLAKCRAYEGGTAVEYAIMVSLVALTIFGAVLAVGGATDELYDCASTAVGSLPDSPDC